MQSLLMQISGLPKTPSPRFRGSGKIPVGPYRLLKVGGQLFLVISPILYPLRLPVSSIFPFLIQLLLGYPPLSDVPLLPLQCFSHFRIRFPSFGCKSPNWHALTYYQIRIVPLERLRHHQTYSRVLPHRFGSNISQNLNLPFPLIPTIDRYPSRVGNDGVSPLIDQYVV